MSAGVKSCAAGAGEANLRNGDEEDASVVAGRAANERTKAAAAADEDDGDAAEGSTASTAETAPRFEAAARAWRNILECASKC